jgi:parallel beta-helix repeat protein
MKKFTRKSLLLFILGLIFGFYTLINTDSHFYQFINSGNLESETEQNLKKSGFWEIEPIEIDDNDPTINWLITKATYDWCSGNGNIDDPYLIENVTIDAGGSGDCISIQNSNVYFKIKNCTLMNAGQGYYDAGIDLNYVNNGTLINNNCSFNKAAGISLEFCDNNIIKENFLFHNGWEGNPAKWGGIFLKTSNYNNITKNICYENNKEGIYIWDSSTGNNVNENILNYSSNNGISLISDYNNITNNKLYNNSIGIELYYSDYNTLSANQIENSTNDAIYLDSSTNNYILKNNRISHNDYGIHLDSDSNNNVIRNSNITENNLYGLLIETNCINSKIYNNIFKLNTIHSYDQGTNNQWDNGSLGNYWDDYGGVDANDDGIGDTPYDVPPVGGSVDNYPIWRDGDDVGPDITIDLPIEDEIFGIDAPNFTITITDQTLNTTWYTIDGGLTNFTFSGFEGTVNQSAWDDKASEPILLRFYANDSVGNIDFEDVNIEKDADAPTITINSPTPNQMCGVPAPSFDVIINDPHFHKKWYSLDGGENITYTTETQIDQIEWDKFGNGTVLITFYANDTLGNENSTQVIVRKDVYLPKLVIHSPTLDELFEDIPPVFNVEITDHNLHKMWYSIDGGSPKIFTENESITQSLWDAASEGIIDLTFFANDTAGNINFTSVNIIKDTLIPSIEIISPEPNEIFREIAPSFEISITEVNLVSRWYSIDGGLTNKSFTGLNGTIDEILWWDAPLGPITIRFYAEDIAGNIGFEDVVVIKKLIKSLSVEIVEQSFSKEAFNITFLIYNETEHGISNAAIQLWWDGTEFSSNILNLGDGLYFISLESILVPLGDDPILLNMTISADEYQDKYFETYLNVEPYEILKFLQVEITNHSYSLEHFNFTFSVFDETGYGIDYATIQIWWDGTEFSSNILNLGNGYYFVSLEAISVAPGEDPILLSMIISADGYEDKYFETYLAVDPDTLEKEVEKDGEEFPLTIIIIAFVSAVGGIGATIITVVILRKRKLAKEVI